MKPKTRKTKMPQSSADTISAVELCKLTNLTDSRHRQLADKGWFPPPINARYQLLPTFRGLTKYYREGVHRLTELKERQLIEDIRLTKAQVAIRQMEEARLRADAMNTAAVGKLINECFLPVSQKVETLASELAQRCNPSDPALAHAALVEWVASFFAQVNEKLPKESKPRVKKSK